MRLLQVAVGGMVFLVAGGTAWPAQDRALMLSNKATQQISAFKVTPVDGSAAAIDVLAGRPLASGGMRNIVVPSASDRCAFDLEIVYGNGTVDKREAVDFCNLDGYIVEN